MHAARRWLAILLCLCQPLVAGANSGPQPAIAVIIDDLGNQHAAGQLATALPGPVACAFLPSGPFTQALALRAHSFDKEVMLHLPMQASGALQDAHEAGELTVEMTHVQYRATVARDLAAVPYVSGLNNHMGSLLTRHPGNMAWLMQALGERGKLFFIDSRTTTATVARRLADEYGIPSSQRDVFLDNDVNLDAIRAQFRRLLALARRNGTALAIGHPNTATLQLLQEEIPRLGAQGIRLVPVARLIELQAQDRHLVWQAYSSR